MSAPDYTFIENSIRQEIETQLSLKLEPLYLKHVFKPGSSSSHQLPAVLNSHIPAISASWPDKIDRQFMEWLRLALELNEYGPENPSKNQGAAPVYRYLLPSLVFYVCSVTGATHKAALMASTGVEFLGKASILFDDIQDQDKPDSIIKVTGEGAALNLALILLQAGEELIGDAFSYELLSEQNHSGLAVEFLPKNGLLLPIRLLSSVSFAARGQLLDLQEKQIPLADRMADQEYYLQKSGLKTGTLVSHWLELGAMLGGATNRDAASEFLHDAPAVYYQAGFNLGMVLHLISDLKEFSIAVQKPEISRDLAWRNLTLPYIFIFKELHSAGDSSNMLRLWQQMNSDEATRELGSLLKLHAVTAFTRTLGMAVRYLVEAESQLKKLDPNLEKGEHLAMLEMFKNLIRKFRGSSLTAPLSAAAG